MLCAWLVQLPRWYLALATIAVVLAMFVLCWHLADCLGEYGISVEKRKDEIVVEVGCKAATPCPETGLTSSHRCECRSCH